MKALSGYAEWFWLMAKNWKDVENRNWPLPKSITRDQFPYRIYLHASLTRASVSDIQFMRSHLTRAQVLEFEAVDWDRYRGHIIGEISIVDEITLYDIGVPASRSPWLFGPYGWVVKDGVLYDEPIRYKGQLNFFEVQL